MTIKKIGNSHGIILPKQIMAMCAITNQVSVVVENGKIVISATDTPRAGWDAQFKDAIAAGELPEEDLFEGTVNEFDKEEWKW